MAEGSPNRPQPPAQERYRLTLRQGPHQWTFAFTRGDAEALMHRVRELARDPDAPLDWLYGQSVCRQVRRLLAATTETHGRPENPDPVDPMPGESCYR